MGKVTVTVHELSNTNMTVDVDGDRTTLSPTQSRDFSGSRITISDEDNDASKSVTNLGIEQPDVFDHGNPNGIQRAEIGPKLAKAAGETRQEVVDDGRVLEKEVAKDQSLATAAGGIDGAEEGKTPGPEINQQGVSLSSGAKATGSQAGKAEDPSKPAVDPNKNTTQKASPATPPSSKR